MIAGQRREREVVNVDYADVLRQAVDNERWRLMREVLKAVDAISTTSYDKYSYSNPSRKAEDYKKDLKQRLEGMMKDA